MGPDDALTLGPDLAVAPSIDIANGAPTGADGTDRIVMSYISGTLADPHVYFTESTNRSTTRSTPRAMRARAIAGSTQRRRSRPTGTDVYVVYNAFMTPFQPPRPRRARSSAVGAVIPFV